MCVWVCVQLGRTVTFLERGGGVKWVSGQLSKEKDLLSLVVLIQEGGKPFPESSTFLSLMQEHKLHTLQFNRGSCYL